VVCEFGVPWSPLDCGFLSGGGKNCVVYSLFCMFIFVIIIIIIVIIGFAVNVGISFVALLNCLCLNPQISPFVHFSSLSCCGGELKSRRVAVWCIVAGCWVKLP